MLQCAVANFTVTQAKGHLRSSIEKKTYRVRPSKNKENPLVPHLPFKISIREQGGFSFNCIRWKEVQGQGCPEKSPPSFFLIPLPFSRHLHSSEMLVSCSRSLRTDLTQHLRRWRLPMKSKWVIGLWFWNITPDILMPGWPCYMFQLFLNRSRLCQTPAACEDPQMKVNPTLSSSGRSSVPVPSAPVSRKPSHPTNRTKRRSSDSFKSLFLFIWANASW